MYSKKLIKERIIIMIKLTLKDGSIREVENGIQASEVIKSIGMGLYKS